MTAYGILSVKELADGARQNGNGWLRGRIDYAWLRGTISECGGDPWLIAERKRKLDQPEEHWKDKQLEMYLALLWAKPLGLRPTQAHEKVCRLVLGCDVLAVGAGGLFDHTYFFRSGQGLIRSGDRLVIATHPYNVNARYREDAARACEETGAVVEYPDFPSWWNWNRCSGQPGYAGTTLVVWSAGPEPLNKQ
jgi:hypothetical protein